MALVCLSAGCRFPLASATAPLEDDAAWQPELVDIHDQRHVPFADEGQQALVIVFIMHDCPISNSYIPALNRLHDWVVEQPVSLVLVHADPEITLEEARKHAEEYKIAAPVVLDPEQVWAQLAEATRVPEAAVFSRSEEVLYLGRIDDQYAAPGKRRAVTRSNDLRDALQCIVSGKPVAHPRTEAVGCFIPTKKVAKQSAGADENANP